MFYRTVSNVHLTIVVILAVYVLLTDKAISKDVAWYVWIDICDYIHHNVIYVFVIG